MKKVRAFLSLLFLGLITSCFSEQRPDDTIEIRDDRINVVLALNGQMEGSITHKPITGWSNAEKENYTVYGFTDQGDRITWYLDVPEDGSYNLGFQFTGSIFKLPSKDDTLDRCFVSFEIGDRVMKTELLPLTAGDMPSKITGRRQWLDGEIDLKKGVNKVVFFFDELSQEQQSKAAEELEKGIQNKGSISFGLSDLMLVKSSVLKQMKARASEMKPDFSWMKDGKYGLFIHWSMLSYPLYGDQQAMNNFEWGVNKFDVEEFADKVYATGASWIIFTVNHGWESFPAPIKSIDNVWPGRTTERDLIAELADALDKKGVKLMLYFNLCPRDEVAHRLDIDGDPEKWFQFNIDVVKEVSLRYGEKLAGWGYIDSSLAPYLANLDYPKFYMALKAGNPNAVVGISSHWYAEYSPFNDMTTGDAGSTLVSYIDDSMYEQGGRYEGLQGHAAFVLDGSWIPREPYNGTIRANSDSNGGPSLSDEEYIDYFKKMDEADIPVTVNIMITQDVTKEQPFFNPKSLELMKRVKKALKGDQ